MSQLFVITPPNKTDGPLNAYRNKANAENALQYYPGCTIEEVIINDHSDFASARKDADEARAVLVDKAKEYFSTEAAKIFAAYPTLEKFRTKNFTIYFADGSECNFGVGDPELKMPGGDPEDVDEEGFFIPYGWSGHELTPEVEAANEAVKSLIVSVGDDIIKDTWGDHVQVTVTREGNIEVEDYSDHE